MIIIIIIIIIVIIIPNHLCRPKVIVKTKKALKIVFFA